MKPSARTLENVLLFQLGWLAVVLLGTDVYHWFAIPIVGAVLWRHLALSGRPTEELTLAFMALGFGLIWESSLVAMGIVQYAQGQIIAWLAPFWLILMWPMLATTLNVALRCLHGRVWIGALFGGIGGPLAFLAGEGLGAVMFPDKILALTMLAMGWAVFFPMLIGLGRRLDGAQPMDTVSTAR